MICDTQCVNDVLESLNIEYKICEKIIISGYIFDHLENKIFYLKRDIINKNQEFLIIEIAEEYILELDKFQSSIGIKKHLVNIENQTLVFDGNEYLIYLKRNDDSNPISFEDVETLSSYMRSDLQLKTCDLYLLIPGKFEKGNLIWEDLQEQKSEVFDIFNSNISKCIEDEYNSDFKKKLSRKCLGYLKLEINAADQKYVQNAIVGIVKHDTGFCIIEIMVQNCCIGGNKLLNYYCCNEISYIWRGEKYTLDQYLSKLHIRKYGKKRSMVFQYGNVSEEEIINALANEEKPMGKIEGIFKQKVRTENIAQYDTAEVYVSQETMFEKCKSYSVFGDDRISYHAIEIFFVELIMFQDASIDKIYIDLKRESEIQKEFKSIKESAERYEKISFDMSQAISFADYEQFNFPTVRESAKNVAKCFGIDHVFEKYEMNKDLLNSMILTNKRKIQQDQDNIKNKFLLLLSALTVIGMLGEIIYVIFENPKEGILSYIIALLLVLLVFVLYELCLKEYKKCRLERREKGDTREN